MHAISISRGSNRDFIFNLIGYLDLILPTKVNAEIPFLYDVRHNSCSLNCMNSILS